MNRFSQIEPLTFQRAHKIIKKARIGICGVSGSGKTLSALKIAGGLEAASRSSTRRTTQASSTPTGSRLTCSTSSRRLRSAST